ncbi:hypothetical protein EXS56_02850 [Candidatus Kaiserbacteria bacterium]|nr:hypothetical protein [Candidatus Kaiserbacteria bacterium]
MDVLEHPADADGPREATMVAPLTGCEGCWLHTSNCVNCTFNLEASIEEQDFEGEPVEVAEPHAKDVAQDMKDPSRRFDRLVSRAKGERAARIMKQR